MKRRVGERERTGGGGLKWEALRIALSLVKVGFQTVFNSGRGESYKSEFYCVMYGTGSHERFFMEALRQLLYL